MAIFAYIAPLLTIFYSYFRILYTLHKRSDRQTFRFVKCKIARNGCNKNQVKNSSTSNIKSFKRPRRDICEHSCAEEEINSHNTKTITRAKLKTLKLTVLIGKNISSLNIKIKYISR